MSARFLAELDAFYGGNASVGTSHIEGEPDVVSSSVQTIQNRISSGKVTANPGPDGEDDDDEFGDFEGPAPVVAVQSSTPSVAKPSSYDPWADMQWSARQTPAEAQRQVQSNNSSSIAQEAVSNRSVFDPDVMSKATSKPTQRSARPAYDDNVLFDAEADEDEDDYQSDKDAFGAFEMAAVPPKTEMVYEKHPPAVVLGPLEPRPTVWEAPKRRPPPNLLDVDDEYAIRTDKSITMQPQGQTRTDELANLGGWEAYEDDQITRTVASQHRSAPDADPVFFDQDHNTGTWEDFDASLPDTSNGIHTGGDGQTPIDLPRLLPDVTTSNAVPPTNIPPPAVLFTLFPRIFDESQSIFFEPLGRLASDTNQRIAIITHPITKQFVRDYMTVAVVCAHVVGGRKNRWKRDVILAQSMRIGPASASGKSGGMKLTGLDKGENAREEREATEVVAAWKRQAGKLRTAVAGVDGLPRLPELSDAMPVRMATQSEGALNSPKPCVLCGLKRNERINKIDIDVQDSFGEWWVEHWGHRTCMAFWEANKNKLTGR